MLLQINTGSNNCSPGLRHSDNCIRSALVSSFLLLFLTLLLFSSADKVFSANCISTSWIMVYTCEVVGSSIQIVHRLYTDCTQIVHRLYTDCTQILHRLYTDCTQIVHRLYTDCTQIVHRLYTDCTQIVHRLYTDCTQIVHRLYTDCTQILHLLLCLLVVYFYDTDNVCNLYDTTNYSVLLVFLDTLYTRRALFRLATLVVFVSANLSYCITNPTHFL